jgi:hypothetical protein
MKCCVFFFVFVFLSSPLLFGQDSLKTNPIIYGDFGITPVVLGQNNIQINSSINYQIKSSLFTARITGLGNFDEMVYTLLVPETRHNLFEPALLYGLRNITRGHSFSISAGISADNWITTFTYKDQYHRASAWYPGLPFEVNYIWFRAKKRKTRLYDIFPVGKPTGFGGSIGFKLSGAVSQHSYASFGITFGLGYHRHY